MQIEKSDLMRRIASELRDLILQAHDIEDAVLHELGGNTSARARQTLQQMDRSAQTLSSLAECIDELANSDPTDAKIAKSSLLDAVQLDSVAERLVHGIDRDAQHPTGEPEVW